MVAFYITFDRISDDERPCSIKWNTAFHLAPNKMFTLKLYSSARGSTSQGSSASSLQYIPAAHAKSLVVKVCTSFGNGPEPFQNVQGQHGFVN